MQRMHCSLLPSIIYHYSNEYITVYSIYFVLCAAEVNRIFQNLFCMLLCPDHFLAQNRSRIITYCIIYTIINIIFPTDQLTSMIFLCASKRGYNGLHCATKLVAAVANASSNESKLISKCWQQKQ